jgi:hypothetical protein
MSDTKFFNAADTEGMDRWRAEGMGRYILERLRATKQQELYFQVTFDERGTYTIRLVDCPVAAYRSQKEEP